MPRFPLYAKILFWFFLNLVVLAAVFFLVFRAQFRLGLDWVLAGSAAERLEAVSRLILVELADRPSSEWNQTLERFGNAYQVHFYIFKSTGGQLAGESLALPQEVKARLASRPSSTPHVRAQKPPERTRPPTSNDESRSPRSPAPPSPAHRLPPPHLAAHEPYPKFLVRTTNPTRYWMCVRGVLPNPDNPEVTVTLLALSSSLSAGGLLLDLKPWFVAGLGTVVLSALLWFPFVRGITRSITQITQATRNIAEGRFEVRVGENRHDELGSLGLAINQLASRLSGFVTGQKRFLGDIAHELCSPLARLQVALGILDQRADVTQKRYVRAACEKADQISALVNQLLSFSKASFGASTIRLQPVSVGQAVQKAAERECNDAVSLQIEVPGNLSVLAEPELLAGSISNLLRNAIRYAGQAGPITVSAQRDGSQVLLIVADRGPGIPEEHLAHVFDPFYRVDTSRDRSTGGAGLGLTLVKTCIESCGGSVTCRNRKPSGLEVIIRLSA